MGRLNEKEINDDDGDDDGRYSSSEEEDESTDDNEGDNNTDEVDCRFKQEGTNATGSTVGSKVEPENLGKFKEG